MVGGAGNTQRGIAVAEIPALIASALAVCAVVSADKSGLTLSLGDLLTIGSIIAGATWFIVSRFGKVDEKIHVCIRQHEGRCANYDQGNPDQTNPRGVPAIED